MKKDKILKEGLGITIFLFLVISILFPVFNLFTKAFIDKKGNYIGINNFIEYFKNPVTASSLGNSLKISITVTLISVILAFLFSYGINRTNIKGKNILKGIAFLPLFAPTMTHGIALIYLFGRQGIITKYIGLKLPIYGFLGIVLAEIIYVFPILFFMMVLSFDNEDYRKYEMANIMGINKIKQFFTITLPSIKYSLITCFFSGFTLSFTDFGAPKVIGGNYNVLSTDVFKQVIGQQNFSMGSTVGILLIIPALIAFICDLILKNRISKLDNKATKYVIKENKIRDYFFYILTYLLSFIIVCLFLIILVASFVKGWPYDISFSFKSYNFSIMGESIWKIFINSILISLISAILGTTICFFTAYLIEREKKYLLIRKIGYFLSILPNAIPGLTIGIAYIFFFNSLSNNLNFIYGTIWIIVLANIIHFFATPYLAITNSLKQLDNEYENISNLMGISWIENIIKVIIPLSINSIIESFSYYFINSMITVSAVIFLYTSKTRLISIMMISKNDSGDISSAAAIGVMIILFNIFFKVTFDLFIKYLRRKIYLKKRKRSLEKEKQGEILREYGREVLVKLNEVSKKTKVKYWLEFGTLLGKIRENNFIGHDINFDIGIMKDELTPDFLMELENNGFTRKTVLFFDNELKTLTYIYKGIIIELFIFVKDKDKILCYIENENKEKYVYRLTNTTLKEVEFMGIKTYIPRNSMKRLLEIYGNNFNVPDGNWKDEMCSVRIKI